MKTREEILQMVEEEDVEFIRLQFTDMFGTLKNVAVTATQLEYMKDNSYLIDGKYWIDDSAEDMQVTRNGCRKMLKQFDALTENIRRAVGWEN